jgi:MoxR-like ATPase
MSTETTGRTSLTAYEVDRAREIVAEIEAGFSSRVVGQEALRRSLLVALMVEGHVLLESVPGLAKTLAASTLASVVRADFARIQCTPDLLPSDIIGTQVYDPRRHEFETQLGPVHAHFVLLDEINRASAKTQSAVLEAMQERQTSIAGVVHRLPEPFLVLATQNPIDEEGTYLLPHAQLDRFLLKEIVDYPEPADEVEVLDRVEGGVLGRGAGVTSSVDLDDVRELHAAVARVYVDRAVKRHIVDLVDATRKPDRWLTPELARYVEVGASPRGTIALFSVARALAVLAGRDHVVPEDVHELRHAVLRHRVHLTYEAVADGVPAETVVDAVFAAVPTP